MQFLGYSFIYDEDAFLYNHVTVSSEITSIELSDGCFDGIYVSSDSDFKLDNFPNDPDYWNDNDTIMYTDFSKSCNANKSKIDLSTIDGLVIKKLDVDNSKAKWQTIYIRPVNKESNMNFEYIDYICRQNREYKYNIVPIANGIETYMNNEVSVKSKYDGIYITDGHTQYGTILDIDSKHPRKINTSILEPINSRYPVSVKNGMLNYSTGSVTARFLELDDNCDVKDLLLKAHDILVKQPESKKDIRYKRLQYFGFYLRKAFIRRIQRDGLEDEYKDCCREAIICINDYLVHCNVQLEAERQFKQILKKLKAIAL